MSKPQRTTQPLASVPTLATQSPVPCAQETLRAAAQAITDNEALDTLRGRSMAAAVHAFNAIEGTFLTERQSWAFLQLVHLSRAGATASNGKPANPGDMQAAAAYAALAGEAAQRQNG